MNLIAVAAALAAVALWTAPVSAATVEAATCPTSLGGRPFTHLELMVGSPDGKFGTIAQSRSEFDQAGKHGRDLYPLADEKDVFLRCHYEGGRVTVTKLPPGTALCEVAYTYIDDYDTRADRISCR